MEIVYKVTFHLKNDGEDKFISACTYGDARLEYKLGEKTIPVIPNSKIFAFRTLEDVKTYLTGGLNYYCAVFKCEAENITDAPEKVPNNTLVKEIEQYWSGEDVELFFTIPKGTVFCDSVTPIERIYLEGKWT